MANHIEDGCTRRVIIDEAGPRFPEQGFAENFRKCGQAAVVYSIGDGAKSFYCEAHAARDDQGYYRDPIVPTTPEQWVDNLFAAIHAGEPATN